MTTLLAEAYRRRIDFFNQNHDPRDGKFTSGAGGRKHVGTGAKGGKVWSGISADPDNRTRPKSNVSFPIEPEGYESPAEARAIFATRIYDADLGNGYQARVASVRTIPNGVSVTIKIRKGNEEAALSTRELSIDGAGRLVAYHETLYVEPKHQGNGIADRFNAHAVAEYQRIGVDRIDLHAGDTVGGYAWARQGFRHFEGGRKKFLLEQLDRLDAQMKHPAPVLRPHAKKIKADSAAMRKAIEAGEDVQPIHLASLGEKYARHTGHDDFGQSYPTWPGKSLLIGTTWFGQYYFDADKTVTAAATDLEHAALRPAFMLEFYNHNHDARDGKFTSGVQHVTTSANAEAIVHGGFQIGEHTMRTDRHFGEGVYASPEGDTKSAKYYANRQLSWRDAQVVHGTVTLDKPLHVAGESPYAVRRSMVDALGGNVAVAKMAQAHYDRNVETIRTILREELGPDMSSRLNLDAPETTMMWDVPTRTIDRAMSRLRKAIPEGIDPIQSNADYKHLAKNIDEIMKSPGKASDQWEHATEWLGNLAKEAGYDGLVVDSKRWGNIGGSQVVVFDPSKIKVTGVHPYGKRQGITASGEEFACHDAACAPPPAGVGGSSPLQARRGAVAGYGPTARRDITLGSVRVTYKPDYPDGHPDPGEVVWAKVRFQEDVHQSKDRPVLIIGRINGSDKLAAVQLTSNVSGRSDSMMIGTGSWDRLGRNSAVKLGQIIVVDPKDYRREGSKFERDKFEAVIGRLAAYHRTPVQIAASAKLLEHWHEGEDFAIDPIPDNPDGYEEEGAWPDVGASVLASALERHKQA